MEISRTLIDRLANARYVVAFTGAGVSAESGVATFRAKDGLWSRFKPEELANVQAFLANPQMVWEWYQARREVMLGAEPNAGHRALVEMEKLVRHMSVITQNIDGLHGGAGSTEVVELHGNMRRNFCQQCGRRYDEEALLHVREVPRCECGGNIRPDIVWFGEYLPADAMALAERRSKEAGVFFSIGTSAVVYPAAGLPMLARDHGAYLVEINPEETPLTQYAHEVFRDASGTVLPVIVAALRARTDRTAP